MSPAEPAPAEIHDVPLDALVPDPRNPRRIDDEALCALARSLQEFGVVQPIVARRADRRV